ncbi:MAG: tRNA pseudouridine(55) synthase TruB [Spirochaetaceae bacterium]
MNESLDGLLLLNKPAGVTSFQALRPVKQLLPGKTRVGHTGTLDRFATGLLVVLLGKATRLVPLFTAFDKSYTGTFRFGEETETLDPERPPRPRGEAPTTDQLAAVLPRFVGRIEQVPPAYSAVHLEGERAYRRVLRGEQVQIPSREVTIHSLKLLRYDIPDARIEIHCSKGTYVRSLARDIAEACGCGGYLTALRRDSVGPFLLKEAVAAPSREAIRPLEEVVPKIPGVRRVDLSSPTARRVQNGAKLRETLDPELLRGEERFLGLYTPEGRLIAMAEQRERAFHYILVRP